MSHQSMLRTSEKYQWNRRIRRISAHRYTILPGLLLLLLLTIIQPSDVVYAQSDTIWDEPINLSRSGSTYSPSMFVDSQGLFHVIWIDEFAGFVYSRQVGDQWSQPTSIELPFAELVDLQSPSLKLLGESNGYTHAFWINGNGNLAYSRVNSDDFGNINSWAGISTLAESAAAYEVIIDDQNVIHVAYARPLQTSEFPAGIYYRKSEDSGSSWSLSVALFNSSYLRTLTPDSAHIDLSATSLNDGSTRLYISWDNPERNQIYLTKSFDQGNNWETPTQINPPDMDTHIADPFNVVVHANGDNVIVIWNDNLQSDFDCTLFYQASPDGGSTWNESQSMLSDLVGCPKDNVLFSIDENMIMLKTTIQEDPILPGDIYLLVWNGFEWSNPQAQSFASIFIDPETLETINLGFRQIIMTRENRLVVVGSDTISSKDVWIISRRIESTNEWFPPPDMWSNLVEITQSETRIRHAVSVADQEGKIYVFWIQQNADDTFNAIYNSRLEGDIWSNPSLVLSTENGMIDEFDVEIDANNRVFVVWSDAQLGEIYLSWADAAKANNASEWAKPITIPTPHLVAHSPNLMIDQTNTIYITYALPLNEDRGIYIVSSSDEGSNWSQPVKIFDASAAGWNSVDNPKLAYTNDGRLQILWQRVHLLSGIGPDELYYASSDDMGNTWTEPFLVVEMPTSWFEIINTGERTLHRFWEIFSGSESSLWHDISVDGGLTWTIPENLSRFGEIAHFSGVEKDANGRIHLLQVISNIDEEFILDYRTWTNDGWETEERSEFGPSFANSVINGMVLTNEGILGVNLIRSEIDKETEIEQYRLMFTSRIILLPLVITQPALETTPIPETQETPPDTESETTPTDTLVPTQTINVNDILSSPSAGGLSMSSLYGIAIGSIIALLIIGLGVFIGIRIIKR